MFNKKEDLNDRNSSLDTASESNLNFEKVVREGAADINITKKSNASPGVYELQDNGATYSVGLMMLRGIKKFFQLFKKSKNNPFPTIMLWYKGLSKEQKKTVMIISKERTENDSSSERNTE
jgi:hypothetical protein